MLWGIFLSLIMSLQWIDFHKVICACYGLIGPGMPVNHELDHC